MNTLFLHTSTHSPVIVVLFWVFFILGIIIPFVPAASPWSKFFHIALIVCIGLLGLHAFYTPLH